MRIAVIGDVHGRDIWKQIILGNYDKVIFLGDYMDSYYMKNTLQVNNLLDILEYKKNNIDKVELVIGNHDYHYLPYVREDYSGYNYSTKIMVSNILYKAVDGGLINACYNHNNHIIFSHAGITKTWLNNNGYTDGDISLFVNDMFKYKPNSFRFTSGKNHSMYGDDITQPPIWVREKSLKSDKIDGYIQVVGHTMVDEIKYDGDIIMVDSLHNNNFLIIENNEFKSGKI